MKRNPKKLVLLLLAAITATSAQSLHAQKTWTGANNNNWFNNGNWSPAGAPASSDDVLVNNAGTPQVGNPGAVANTVTLGDASATSGTLNVQGNGTLGVTLSVTVGNAGTGTLNITGAASATLTDASASIGEAMTGVGTATVANTGKWTNTASLTIGDSGNGTLTIKSGGTVSNVNGVVGSQSGSTGSVTVDANGGASMWTNSGNLTVGDAGNGTLAIKNAGAVSDVDGSIGNQSTSTSSVTVNGTGSTWTNSATLDVGNSGNGTLNIQASGAVSDTSATIADQTGSTGAVNIAGKNSMWTNSSSLTVGNSGDGTLDITGGTVADTSATIADQTGSTGLATVDGKNSTWTNSSSLTVGNSGNGTLMVINGGTVTNTDGTIADQTGSTGAATVDGTGGASTWTMTGDLTVGNSGNGTLMVLAGGAVSSVSGTIANQTGSTGTVTVDGAGSMWTIAGAGSSLKVGVDGTGELDITNGGAVSALTNVVAGFDSGSMGTIKVDGAGSTLAASLLIIGDSGNGFMNVTNGGVVTSDSGVIANFVPSNSSVTVDGTGSQWTISGTLMVGNTGNGSMSITNGGAVSNTDATIAGSPLSTSMVTVDGTGSTWTNSATLSVGDQGNGSMSITNGGAVSNTNGTIGNNAGSAGTVTVDGAGSTWTNNGTFDVGFSGNGTLNITNGGTVTVTGFDARIAEQATSTSSVIVDGSGSTWTIANELDVARNGTGTLTIQNGGTVNMTGSGRAAIGVNAGSNGTAIVDGAGSTWTDSADLWVGGDNGGPGGTGLLRIQNGGTVNVTGNMTVWSTGTLEVGSYVLNAPNLNFDGATLRTVASTNFINNATIGSGGVTVDDDGFVSTLSGVFTGPGGLTKIGDGTIIISNANTYTGDTNINAGTLQVDGSITSNTFVNAGGTLSGIGTITGNVTNSGNVSPGDSPGTLTITGNYTQNSTGTLTIEVASETAHDLLQVGGAAGLDGTLQILKLDNFAIHAGDKIIILSAGGGVNGQFATVMDDFTSQTLVTPEVIYEADDVALLFAQASFLIPGLTPNQQAVAANLNKSIGDPRAADLLNFLDTELIANLPHDYDLIAPEELAALYEISFSKAVVENQNLQHRMDDIRAGSSGFSSSGFNMTTSGNAPQDPGLTFAYSDGKVVLPVDNKDKNVMTPTPENRWGVWVTGYGDFVNVDGNDNAHGYDISTGSVLVGLDYKVCDHFAVGLDGNFSGGQANLVDNGRIDYDGGQAGAYATIYGFKSFLGNIIHFDLAVNGGWNDYDTVRNGLQNMPVRGSTNGSEFNAMIAYGGDWYFGHWLVGTWSTLQYTNVNVDSFTETGSLAPLHFPDQSEDSFRGSTGLRLAYNANWGRTIFRPEIRAAWAHEYGDQAYPIDARFASGAGGIFTVHGPDIGRDSALVDAGFSLLWNERVSTYLFYDGNLGRSHYDNNAVSGGFRITF